MKTLKSIEWAGRYNEDREATNFVTTKELAIGLFNVGRFPTVQAAVLHLASYSKGGTVTLPYRCGTCTYTRV